MRGVGKRNVAPRDGFPPFPSHFVPGSPHLTAVFVRDYWELRAKLSNHGLAVDHQRKVVKRTLGGGVVGHGGRHLLSAVIVLGVYVVPDTALSWGKEAVAEVVQRHKAVKADVSTFLCTFLYMDCACCNGKPRYRRSQDTGTSVACLWRSMFHVKLDAMHLMLRICREMNAEHPRRKKFLVDLSTAIFVQHQGDRMRLLAAREAAGLEGPPTRVERVRYIRRVVDAPEAVADRMLQVLQAHRELDNQC